MGQQGLAPIEASARIQAIDAVRGFALLGIFLVNSEMFGDAIGAWMSPGLPAAAAAGDIPGYYFIKVFCEGKFYPLFSMLFGAGLVLQWQRAREAGRPFLGTGLRRLAVLGTIGLLHATLLWYGDVLFVYSLAGVVLLLMCGARVRTLVTVGSIMVGVSVLLTTAVLGLMALMDQGAAAAPGAGAGSAPVASAAPAMPEGPPFSRLMRAMGERSEVHDPSHPFWVEAEREAYREGPWAEVLKFRLMSYAFYLVFGVTGFIWHIVGMFLLGAALMKSGVFSPERRHWHVRFVMLGALVGLPAAALAAVLPVVMPEGGAMAAATPLTMLGGPLMSLGYLGALTLLVGSGRARRVTGALAKVGRMALTNYLLQTVIATGIFYYYGLGLFGQTTRMERVGMVLGIYLCQVGFSVAWLRFFRFGPMEWVWRSLTYLRPQAMLRAGRLAPSVAVPP